MIFIGSHDQPDAGEPHDVPALFFEEIKKQKKAKKIQFSIAAPDNYVDREGNRGSQFIPLEALINAAQKTNGIYDYLNCCDLANVSYSVRNNNYTEAVYGMALLADNMSLLENKASKEARLAAKAAAS